MELYSQKTQRKLNYDVYVLILLVLPLDTTLDSNVAKIC